MVQECWRMRAWRTKTPGQFAQVFQTKVGGLRALLAGLTADELRFLVLFSSSTARFGRTGQVDYAMANEALNKLAWQISVDRPVCRVISLNWGPWDGGMVTPALRELFAREGRGSDQLASRCPAGGRGIAKRDSSTA
jgi:hypothetical protein